MKGELTVVGGGAAGTADTVGFDGADIFEASLDMSNKLLDAGFGG